MTFRARIALTLLACIAVCVAVDIFYFPPTPVFPDEVRFLDTAVQLVTAGEFNTGGDRAFEMPGMALFLSPFVAAFGAQAAVIPVRLVQALMLAVQAAAIGWMALVIFRDRRAAYIALAATCFYPFLIYTQALLLSEMLFTTLLVGAFAALCQWRERGLRIDRWLLCSCALFAAAVLTKATLTVLPPLLLAAAAFCERRRFGAALRVLAIAALAYSAMLSPWWIRNAAVLGEFVPFGSGAGLNLYLGNNPANRTGGTDWATDTEVERVKILSAIPDELARGRAFGKAATDYIAQDPVAFVKRAGQKFVRFWNPVPNAGAFRSTAFMLISFLSFTPILALAIVSAIRNRRRFAALAPVYLLIAYFTLLHVVVIASLRYRLPLEPFLILLASEPFSRIAGLVLPDRTAPG
jgi:4-amino-4-deoxy-L-arabinose transferase-like glycosyltransferase